MQQHEVEGEVQLVAGAVEGREGLRFQHVRLSDEDARWVVALGDLAPTPEHVMHLGTTRVVYRSLPHHPHVPVVFGGGRRVVAQLAIFDDRMTHVDPETRDTAVEPET